MLHKLLYAPREWPLAIRIGIVACAVTGGLGTAGYLWWQEDLRFTKPTPKPPGLQQPAIGVTLPVADLLPRGTASTAHLTFIHFFNPECPCSRFNRDHVNRLRQLYGEKVRFVVALQGDTTAEARSHTAETREDFTGMEVMVDEGGRLAQACGVYSTPQAVILGPGQELVFRGNYNMARYCTDPETEFARLALRRLVAGEALPTLPEGAVTAYGCELPATEVSPSPRDPALTTTAVSVSAAK